MVMKSNAPKQSNWGLWGLGVAVVVIVALLAVYGFDVLGSGDPDVIRPTEQITQ